MSSSLDISTKQSRRYRLRLDSPVMRTGYDNKTPVTLPSFTESCTTRLFDFSPHSSRQTTRNSHPFERDWRDWLAAMFPEVATFASHHEDFWQWVWEIERGVRPRPFCGIWPRGGGKALAIRGDPPIPRAEKGHNEWELTCI